ncbi:hypothetical protein A5482_014765 (plasmid) [Cyanobacterium sp. IPPAS B-1200]|uniref:hypothetical protein n=1 Tax=Cyanobacterium sp. IPPAS B-1200 TaxID=1562720 RepID=UPI0009F39781|nr:hypothetical protein [Cyanobacterium sp. IPPAS B-1200]
MKNLTPFSGKWNHSPTRTIRVPVVLADEVLNYARKLDRERIEKKPHDTVMLKDSLLNIIEKINKKEIGYKVNNAEQLIEDIKALLTL